MEYKELSMKRWEMAGIAMMVALGAHGEYTLTAIKGKLPEGVKTENLNGIVPDQKLYKHGWTEQGWSVGDYGMVRNALVCPSYVPEGAQCMSALTLPVLTIQEGEWLQWESRAGYPLRKERHTVEIRIAGSEEWTPIADAADQGTEWTRRMTDLSAYAGQECELRIVCRSDEGYLLLLNSIRIGKPSEYTFECVNSTRKFFSLAEANGDQIDVEFSIRNLGSRADGVTAVLLVGSERVAESKPESGWDTDETRNFSLPLPVGLNERSDYSIAILTEEGGVLNAAEGFAYVTSKRRRLLVDKGTGMWCNNCPVGTLEIETLESTYGESLITVETHNGDPLANDNYFTWLGYRAIPRFELNRIATTAGDNTKNFKDQICQPTEIGIELTDISLNTDGTLRVTAETSTSELFAGSNRSYRIGYVMTKDIAGDENATYYQSNNCTLATYQQYYYLPSTILYMLCDFPNVSLPSPGADLTADVAFTGIPGSLPEMLEAGNTYTTSWDIPLPDGQSDFSGMRIVAYVLDAGTRRLENSVAAYVDERMGVESIMGGMRTEEAAVYSIDGKRMGRTTAGLAPGIYIIGGKKVKL